MKRHLIGVTLLLAACSDEALAPAPLPAMSAAPAAPDPLPPAHEPIRTVETRLPWGGPAGNLLVDGDFEHSIGFEGYVQQTGWIGFDGVGPVSLRGETGGLCKSGLQCAILVAGQLLFGKGVAAQGLGMSASIWAKPPDGQACSLVQPYLVGCSTFVAGADLVPAAEEPDAAGWCSYAVSIAAQGEGVCLIVDSTLARGETALVDAARLAPNDGTATVARGEDAMRALPRERAERVRHAGAELRKRRRFGAPPPTPLDRFGTR